MDKFFQGAKERILRAFSSLETLAKCGACDGYAHPLGWCPTERRMQKALSSACALKLWNASRVAAAARNLNPPCAWVHCGTYEPFGQPNGETVGSSTVRWRHPLHAAVQRLDNKLLGEGGYAWSQPDMAQHLFELGWKRDQVEAGLERGDGAPLVNHLALSFLYWADFLLLVRLDGGKLLAHE